MLIGYHAFYDERFKALEKTRADLGTKRDEAAESARKVVKTEERLRALERELGRSFPLVELEPALSGFAGRMRPPWKLVAE